MIVPSILILPFLVDDEESTKRNLELFKQKCLTPKPRSDVMKELLTRTFPTRRDTIMNSNSTVMDTTTENSHLKKSHHDIRKFKNLI